MRGGRRKSSWWRPRRQRRAPHLEENTAFNGPIAGRVRRDDFSQYGVATILEDVRVRANIINGERLCYADIDVITNPWAHNLP
jgi:hypothetical protein